LLLITITGIEIHSTLERVNHTSGQELVLHSVCF
jgi:hypothetical protein